MKKISILHENMHTCKADDYYRDVIVQPTTRKVSVNINAPLNRIATVKRNWTSYINIINQFNIGGFMHKNSAT